MQYNDDGITLDYDKLKDCYPSGRGWARFIKFKTNKTEEDDFVYYGKHKGSDRTFNPPIITDSINITRKKLLTKVENFDEEEESQEQSERFTIKQEEGLSQISKSYIFEDSKKENDGLETSIIKIKNKNQEIAQEDYLINMSKDYEDYEGESNTNQNDMIIEKRKVIKKRRINKRAIIGKDIGRKLLDKKINEKKPIQGVNGVKKEHNNFLFNRIPTFLGEYDSMNMYSINRLFYFNPTSAIL